MLSGLAPGRVERRRIPEISCARCRGADPIPQIVPAFAYLRSKLVSSRADATGALDTYICMSSSARLVDLECRRIFCCSGRRSKARGTNGHICATSARVVVLLFLFSSVIVLEDGRA